jgi:hypothetical protein
MSIPSSQDPHERAPKSVPHDASPKKLSRIPASREAAYDLAAELLSAKVPPEDVSRQLAEEGLDTETAERVVCELGETRSQAVRSAGRKNMLYGTLWCLSGVLVTILTYQSAASSSTGGRYVIASVAIAVGVIQFVRGLLQFARR